jgi:hypothetical protein
MSETASATIAFTQINPTTFQYSITLNDTGPTTIGTFWFAWDDLPDQNFLKTAPLSFSSPTGWNALLTHNPGPTDGFGIQWTASSASADIQAGHSLTGFTFTTTDTPAAVFGQSQIDPTFKVTSAFVYTTGPFSDAGFNFAAAAACFCAGTHIRTARGEVPVEDLRSDDMIPTVEGVHRPLVWLGRRRLDCRRHKSPEQVWPVRIARDAFAPGLPICDLYLSPDHAVFVDHMLIPVKCLVNGTTIAQVPMDEVTYYHVELDRHDVLLAEGLPAESYLDTGDRSTFENGGGPIALHPDFAVRVWEAEGYAPIVVAGRALEPIRQRLKGRAALLARREFAAG